MRTCTLSITASILTTSKEATWMLLSPIALAESKQFIVARRMARPMKQTSRSGSTSSTGRCGFCLLGGPSKMAQLVEKAASSYPGGMGVLHTCGLGVHVGVVKLGACV